MNYFTKSVVFWVSIGFTFALSLFAAFGGEVFSAAASEVMTFLELNFGWLYLVAMFFFVVFSICIALGPYGSKRLGKDTDRPEHSTASWLAMLFCAGMGVGLVFWGVAEPVSHYIAPASGKRIHLVSFVSRFCYTIFLD